MQQSREIVARGTRVHVDRQRTTEVGLL